MGLKIPCSAAAGFKSGRSPVLWDAGLLQGDPRSTQNPDLSGFFNFEILNSKLETNLKSLIPNYNYQLLKAYIQTRFFCSFRMPRFPSVKLGASRLAKVSNSVFRASSLVYSADVRVRSLVLNKNNHL